VPKKKASNAAARGLIGGALLGPIGAAAGIITTGEKPTRKEKKAADKERKRQLKSDALDRQYARDAAKLDKAQAASYAEAEAIAKAERERPVVFSICEVGHENHPSRTVCGVCLKPLEGNGPS
jgi:hypothetical protein